MACGGCRGDRVVVNQQPVEQTAPIMEQDGSIVFPEGTDVLQIEGYSVDPNNPRRLVPHEDSACFYKITGIMLTRDGSYKPHSVCRHSECEHRTKPVTPDICKGCPFRSKKG